MAERLKPTGAQVAEAYRRFGHLVARRCRHLLRDEAAAEDTTQEVFFRLWRYGESYAAAGSKLLWLYRVSDRCCLDALARPQMGDHEDLQEIEQTRSDFRSCHGEVVGDREIVLKFLARFDDRLKQIALHHYLDQMTQEEIARAVGWSRQTVVKKLAYLAERAEVLRRQLLREEGDEPGVLDGA